MAKSDLMKKREMLFAEQMLIFKNNVGQHAVALGLTPAQVSAQAADAVYFEYVVMNHNLVQTYAKTWTTIKKSLRRGEKGVEAHETPALDLPAAPAPVAPGVERRFRILVRLVKASDNYNLSIGHELGIEAVDHAPPDYSAIQPKLTVVASGDHVDLGWDWQGFRVFLDMCELQVDRGDGHGFVALAHSTVSGYTDKTPFPAQPSCWRYRAIYHAGNAEVGKWSRIVSVAVPP